MRLLLASSFLLAVLALARESVASPAFARAHDSACSRCHAPVYPALNAFGEDFKENGYQVRGEPPATGFLDAFPIALRAQGHATLRPDADRTSQNSVELQPFQSLYLLFGASVHKNISFVAAATLAPEADVHHAAIGFHNLFSPDGHLNLRMGQLLLADFVRPAHRGLTGFGNPIASTPVGLNPTVLDSAQAGVDLFGRVLDRRLFYRLALLQGATGPDGRSDLDGHMDVLGELQANPHPQIRLGLLGHRGRTQIVDDTGGVRVRFTDRFFTLGGSAEFDHRALNLFGQALYVNHDDPYGDGAHARFWAFRLEARAPLGPRLFFVARYDQLASHRLDVDPFRYTTIHLGYLILANLRVAVESSIPHHDLAASALSLHLDLAL